MVPYLSDDQIYHLATEFLRKHHPSLKCPIPIEEIAERRLDLTMFPVKDLESVCEVDGYISKDFKTILIDEWCYYNNDGRARFTIAHEVGHLILHKNQFQNVSTISSVDDFIQFQNSLDGLSYKRIEIQAYRFAEEILFPKKVFDEVIKVSLSSLGGVESLVITDLGKIVKSITKTFDVSERAALNKLKRDFPAIIETAQANTPF